MQPRADELIWKPTRPFWALAAIVDLILLLFLAKVGWVALAVGLMFVGVGFVLRVEWLLAFLLLGIPCLAFLPLEEDAFTRLLLVFRGLYIAGWWVALGRPMALLSAGRDSRVAVAYRAATRALADPVTIATLALAVWMAIGLSWTQAPRYGESKTIAVFFGNLFILLAPFVLWPLWRDPRTLDRFLRAALLLGLIFAGFGVAASLGLAEQLSFGALVRVQIITKERLAWLGVSQIWTARMLAVWIVLILWSAERKLIRPLVAAAAIALALLLIARTGSRGPLAALIISPFALLFLPRRRESEVLPASVAAGAGDGFLEPTGASRSRSDARGQSRRGFGRLALRWLPAILAVITIVVIALPNEDRTAFVSGLMRGPIGMALSAGGVGEGVSEAVNVRVTQDPSTIYRKHLARRAFGVLEDALPWGAGTGSFPALLFMRDLRLYPHNILAELLLENGWLGLSIFIVFALLVWRSAWRLARRSAAARWLFVLFAMAAANAQVSGDIGTNEWIWLWAGMIAGIELATRPRPISVLSSG